MAVAFIRVQRMLKVLARRHQTIRCNLERVSMSVGFRPQDVAGSDIALGAALDGLRE